MKQIETVQIKPSCNEELHATFGKPPFWPAFFGSLSLVLGSKGVWNWDAIICSQDSASGSNHPLPTGHLHSPGRHCPTME